MLLHARAIESEFLNQRWHGRQFSYVEETTTLIFNMNLLAESEARALYNR